MNTYTLLGSGRLAHHMSHYFSLLGVPWHGWARNPQSAINSFAEKDPRLRLRRALEQSSHGLLLVSDRAIPKLLEQYPELKRLQLIHCSGALTVPGVAGAHPLMTFGKQLYTLEQYQRIPFIVETGNDFKSLFPELSNPAYPLAPEHKALYHSLCVMASNFAQILWEDIASQFDSQLHLPQELLFPYLQQILKNFELDPATALTGPLQRNDTGTIQKHIHALDGNLLQPIYQAFMGLSSSQNQAASERGQ